MNSMSQQGGFQRFGAQSQFNNQSNNRFQPTGYVQSHYQGGIKSQNTGPVLSHIGYSAAQNQNLNQNQNQNHFAGQSFAQSNQFSSGNQYQPVLSHAGGYSANQQSFGHQSMQFNQAQQQPVLSHVGATAGMQSQYRPQSAQQFTQQQAGFGANQQSFNQLPGAQTQQNPVYHATQSAQQEGPVLSHFGGYSAGQQAGSFQNQAGMGSFGMNQR